MDKIAYTLYIFEDALEQTKMEEFVNEAMSLSSPEASVMELKLIQEGFKEKIKDIFDKLIFNIKNIWKKFVNTLDDFIKNDIDYLKKYRETILTKTLKNDVYMMYKYWDGDRELEGSKVPMFNLATFKDKSKEDMEKMLGSQYINKDKSVKDMAKYIFRGKSDQEVKVKSSDIPMSKIYDYCLNYKKFKDILEKDMKEIDKAATEAIVLIDKVPTNESALYSFFDEAVIYEVEKLGADGKPDSGDEKEKEAPSSSSKAPESSIDKKEGDTNKDIEKNVTDKNKDIETCRNYITVFMGFLGAKMSIAEEAYKAYMFIIRDHVKLQTSSKSAEEKAGAPSKDDKKSEDKSKDDSKSDDKDGNATDGKKAGILQVVKNKFTGKGKKGKKDADIELKANDKGVYTADGK